jgi:hypothetical protein
LGRGLKIGSLCHCLSHKGIWENFEEGLLFRQIKTRSNQPKRGLYETAYEIRNMNDETEPNAQNHRVQDVLRGEEDFAINRRLRK